MATIETVAEVLASVSLSSGMDNPATIRPSLDIPVTSRHVEVLPVISGIWRQRRAKFRMSSDFWVFLLLLMMFSGGSAGPR